MTGVVDRPPAPADCTCPHTPSIEATDSVPTGPIKCVCCGSPLELTCANKCGAVDASIAAARPHRPEAPKGTSQNRTYTPKRCRTCGDEFMPTGPRALDCTKCKAAAR